MHEAITFWRMVRWPVIYAALAATTHQTAAPLAVVLMLVFHDDVSEIMRHRRVNVKLPGFEGSVCESVSKSKPEEP